jgi:hypothetical protein
MAIQPIDLQTIFTQLDKVGKSQAMQREGLQLQQALQSVQIQKKTDERAHAVNESHDVRGPERIKDRNSRHQPGEEETSPEGQEETDQEPGKGKPPVVFQDPDIGANIDFCG